MVPAVGLFHCADTGVGILHFSISDFAVRRYGNSQTGKKIPAHRFSTFRQAAAIIFDKTLVFYCEQVYNTYQGVTINGGRLAFSGGSVPSDYAES